MRFEFRIRCALGVLGLVFATSCNGGQTTTSLPSLPVGESFKKLAPTFKTPAVIAYDSDTERLEEWPIAANGGSGTHYVSPNLGIYEATAMVADSYVVTIAEYNPPELVSYDVGTGATTSIADHLGNPLDLAVDGQSKLYALHLNSVGVFRPGSSSVPQQLTCSYMTQNQSIAVDNEGDVFVNGYGPSQFIGVVEYPAGSSTCVKLPLKQTETAYVAGIGVDPKTDDLIVEDNPQLCAGGNEGEITVYSRPYGRHIVAKHNLRANCPGLFRLDATSTKIFFADGPPELAPAHRQKFCSAYGCIDQRSFPDARDRSTYVGGLPTAVTTIPNAIPN